MVVVVIVVIALCCSRCLLHLSNCGFIGSPTQLEWPETVAHRIDQMIAQYPNSIALKDGYGRILTYTEIDERVNSIASALRVQLRESNEQSIVGVFQMPSADWICSLVAINRVGAIYLPLDLRVGIPRLRSNVEAGRPAAILVDNETMGQVKHIDLNGNAIAINVSGSERRYISYSMLLHRWYSSLKSNLWNRGHGSCLNLKFAERSNANCLVSRLLIYLPPRRRKKKQQQSIISLPTLSSPVGQQASPKASLSPTPAYAPT